MFLASCFSLFTVRISPECVCDFTGISILASKPFIKEEEELYCGSIRDFGKPISNMLISGISYMTHENIDRLMANPEWFFRYSGMIQEQ